MNDKPELDLVDLGDAKELTQGPPDLDVGEDNGAFIWKPLP